MPEKAEGRKGDENARKKEGQTRTLGKSEGSCAELASMAHDLISVCLDCCRERSGETEGGQPCEIKTRVERKGRGRTRAEEVSTAWVRTPQFERKVWRRGSWTDRASRRAPSQAASLLVSACLSSSAGEFKRQYRLRRLTTS